MADVLIRLVQIFPDIFDETTGVFRACNEIKLLFQFICAIYKVLTNYFASSDPDCFPCKTLVLYCAAPMLLAAVTV